MKGPALVTINVADYCRPAAPAKLQAALQDVASQDVRLDCSGLQTVPTAILQLLFAADRHWQNAGRVFDMGPADAGLAPHFQAVGLPFPHQDDETRS